MQYVSDGLRSSMKTSLVRYTEYHDADGVQFQKCHGAQVFCFVLKT